MPMRTQPLATFCHDNLCVCVCIFSVFFFGNLNCLGCAAPIVLGCVSREFNNGTH